MLNNGIKITTTPSSGASSGNTVSLVGSDLRMIVVTPTTNTTEYQFKITNADSIIIFDETVSGTLRREMNLPVSGVLTWAIVGASADESFTVYLGVKEKN